jgi:hypothetical protein
MHSGKYVFAQILGLINRYEFEKCVTRYQGDYRTRDLNCWDQFVQLFFGQLTARKGLRDICLCLRVHEKKLYHLGIRQFVNQSTLTRANEHRSWHIFADFGSYLINLVRPLYADKTIVGVNSDNDIFVLDSTTVSVSLKLWKWAPGKYARGAVKIHTLLELRGDIPTFVLITDGRYHDGRALDEIAIQPQAIYVMDRAYVDFRKLYQIHTQRAFFVIRAKQGLNFTVVHSRPVDKHTGLLCDRTIVLNVWKSKKLYPEGLRCIKYYDKEKKNTLIFLTNNMTTEASEIVALYKNRWAVEVFFKLIKQNLQIKALWGHSENAVNIHIWVAICTYLIVAYLKSQLKSELSIHEIMRILEISCFDKTPINELLAKSQTNQNVNEQLTLFNIN